jgi:CRP-like cAMP-binding protein
VTKRTPVPDGKEYFVSTLEENDIFGEGALFEESKRSVSVTAGKDTVMLRFERVEFMEFLSDNPKAAIHVLTFIIEGLLDKLRAARRQLILERGN